MDGAGSKSLPVTLESQAARHQGWCVCMDTGPSLSGYCSSAAEVSETSRAVALSGYWEEAGQGQQVMVTAAHGVLEVLSTEML